MMNDKEIAKQIMRFEHPSRVLAGPPTYELLYYGYRHEGADGVELGGAGTTWTDVFGVGWREEFDDMMGLPVKNPIETPAALAQYRMPDPDSEEINGPIYRGAEAFRALPQERRDALFLSGGHRDTLWEKAYMLVGMERFLTYLYEEPDFCRELLHQIMDFQLGIARHYAACGIELAMLGDDLGTQHSLFFSPDILREFFLPEYRRLFSFYKERGVLISFHSCGHIEPILDVFLELGVDILNPLQSSANDLAAVRERTLGKITLQGGVSSALMRHGTPEQVRRDAQEKLALLHRGGGYFCCPDQGMRFPKENIDALADVVSSYRP